METIVEPETAVALELATALCAWGVPLAVGLACDCDCDVGDFAASGVGLPLAAPPVGLACAAAAAVGLACAALADAVGLA